MENNQNYVQMLITTLRKQVQVLQQVLSVTREQSTIAENESFEEIMLEESLNKKDILIAELNRLDDGFTSVYGRVRSEIMRNKEQYAEDVKTMQTLIKECTDLGNEIRVMEERNREKLAQAFAGKHRSYSSKKNAASVASHYHQTMNHAKALDSYFLDKKN